MALNTTADKSSEMRLLPEVDPKSFLLSAEPWKSVLFLMLTFGLGFALSSALSMLLAISLMLSLMIVGIPLLALTAIAWTYMAQIERARIQLLTGISIPQPYRKLPDEGTFQKVKTFATDPAVWKDLVYIVLLFPIGILQLVIVLFAVITPFAMISAPFSVLLGGDLQIQGFEITTMPGAIAAFTGGIILLPIAAYGVTICARGHAVIARWLLGKRLGSGVDHDEPAADRR